MLAIRLFHSAVKCVVYLVDEYAGRQATCACQLPGTAAAAVASCLTTSIKLTYAAKVEHEGLNEWVVLHRAAPQQSKVCLGQC